MMPSPGARPSVSPVLSSSLALLFGSLGCDPAALETGGESAELTDVESAPFALNLPARLPLPPGGRQTMMTFVKPHGFPETVTLDVVLEPPLGTLDLFPGPFLYSGSTVWIGINDTCQAPLTEYTVEVTGTSQSGDVATATVVLPPDLRPAASFHDRVTRGSLTVAFQDRSVPGGGCGLTSPIVAWEWTFGDGTTSNEQNPVHTYPAGNRSYPVTLTVTNEIGLTATRSGSVFVP